MSLKLRGDVDSRQSNSARALIALALAAGGCDPTPDEPLPLSCLGVQYNTSDDLDGTIFEIEGVRNGVRIGARATITVVSTDPNSVSGTDLTDVILCTQNDIRACTQVEGSLITSFNIPMSRTRDQLAYADHQIRLAPFHATPVSGTDVDGVVVSSYVAPHSNSIVRHYCPPILIRFVRH